MLGEATARPSAESWVQQGLQNESAELGRGAPAAASRPALTEEQLQRIAKNKAAALERKRKAEESKGQGGPAEKRLSSALTPLRDIPAGVAAVGAEDAVQGRQLRAEPSDGVKKAMQALQAHIVEKQQDGGCISSHQAAPAPDWKSVGSSNANAAPGTSKSPSAFAHDFACTQAEGSLLNCVERPTAESWVQKGILGFQEESQQRSKAQSQLNLSGAPGGQATLAFGQKPSVMPPALRRSENVEKLLRPKAHGEGAKWVPEPEEDTDLTQEQMEVKRLVMNGENVFLTGGAGTGKSFLVQNLIKSLKRKFGHKRVAVTATTGIAAAPLGGTSLHSFAGIGIGDGDPKDLADRVKRNRMAKARWTETRVLIVDEVSMLGGDLLEKLDIIAQRVKGVQRGFGGIQLVLVGDFLQLPPVPDKGKPVQFCFETRAWEKLVQHHCELKTVHRQANASFVEVLNQLRQGYCSPEAAALLHGTKCNMVDEGGIVATKLYSKNLDVDSINNQELKKIEKPATHYDATDTGQAPFLDQLEKSCLAPKKLTLKEGAQVMLLKNLDPENGLVNGTRGVVLRLVNNDNADIGPTGAYPMVRFVGCKGEIERLITPDKFSIESQGQTLASREQIPLRLAYALTIHKCQGLTLSKAELSLGATFEFGQAYVALSRVQALEGLRLVDFDAKKVRAHPRVLDFYKKMDQVNLEAARAAGNRKNPLLIDD